MGYKSLKRGYPNYNLLITLLTKSHGPSSRVSGFRALRLWDLRFQGLGFQGLFIDSGVGDFRRGNQVLLEIFSGCLRSVFGR